MKQQSRQENRAPRRNKRFTDVTDNNGALSMYHANYEHPPSSIEKFIENLQFDDVDELKSDFAPDESKAKTYPAVRLAQKTQFDILGLYTRKSLRVPLDKSGNIAPHFCMVDPMGYLYAVATDKFGNLVKLKDETGYIDNSEPRRQVFCSDATLQSKVKRVKKKKMKPLLMAGTEDIDPSSMVLGRNGLLFCALVDQNDNPINVGKDDLGFPD